MQNESEANHTNTQFPSSVNSSALSQVFQDVEAMAEEKDTLINQNIYLHRRLESFGVTLCRIKEYFDSKGIDEISANIRDEINHCLQLENNTNICSSSIVCQQDNNRIFQIQEEPSQIEILEQFSEQASFMEDNGDLQSSNNPPHNMKDKLEECSINKSQD